MKEITNNVTLGIDIGIKNLSLCIFDNQNKKILYWDVVDCLYDSQEIPELCQSQKKDKSNCKFKSKYINKIDEQLSYSCEKHKPPPGEKIETSIIKKKTLKSYKLQDLIYKVINTLNDITEKYNSELEKVTKVKIELQPKFNPKMKMVSHVIYGKLIEYYHIKKTPILFIPAKKKFTVIFSDKNFHSESNFENTYKQRKKLSIEYVNFYINTYLQEEQKTDLLNLLSNNKKRDDLSDSFILAI